ncbi:MAG TPA: hypothetical protein VG890_14625 [Puia sp.]|nr:hypothetical protein [Puia sp.]
MSKTCSCSAASVPPAAGQSVVSIPGRSGRRRNMLTLVRMAVSGFIFLLIPKCPVCLAAWIALGTGIGIPLTAAAWIRWMLIVLSATAFAYLLFVQILRIRRSSRKPFRI